jgi:hypothetical protein
MRRWQSRGMTALKNLPLLAAAASVVAAETSTRRTRATADKKRKPMAGDNLVAAAMWEATRATTIDPAPEAVWLWLVQMGFPHPPRRPVHAVLARPRAVRRSRAQLGSHRP